MISRVQYPKFSPAEYQARWRRIHDAMGKADLDCLVIYGAYSSTFGSDPGQANLRYVTNFADQFHAYCVFPRDSDPVLVTTFNGHLKTGREISVVEDIRLGGLKIADKVLEVLADKGMSKGRLGIVGISKDRGVTLPHEHHVKFASGLPQAHLEDATHLFEDLRRTKSAEEIEFLRRGCAITDKAFEAQMRATQPGARNIDLYNEILFETHRQGGMLTFALLGSTPMSDPDMSFPDAYISDRPLRAGDAVVNEHSSAYGGYSGQILRTVFLGEPTKQYRELFDIAREVFHGVKDAIKPGATTKDVQAAAAPIVDRGLTVTSPLIHGWGYFLEPPIMGVKGSKHPIEDWTFRVGDVVVVEPNPCTADLKAGVFLGDLCVVTKSGTESLHTYPLDEPIIVNGF